jgi:hypothetical protein
MSVRNGIVLLFAISALTILMGCGSSSSNITPVPPPSGGFSNSNLDGTYVFSVSGYDLDGAPVAILGTIIANGSGGNGRGAITGGTIDIVVPDSDLATEAVFDASINGNGFYSVGVDGRGQFTIGTATANPFQSNLVFDFVLQNSSHGLITEFDGNASGSGTLDLQTAGLTQSSLAGSYAFSFSGVDPSGVGTFATVGGFTLDVNGNITAGAEDLNDSGLAYPNESLGGQVLLGPSSSPSTVLSTSTDFGGLSYDVYAIDATHLKFIEIGPLPVLSGDAYSQPSSSISGTLAFTLAGALPNYSSVALGGFMVTDGAGSINNTSTEDINEDGSVVSSAAVNFSATYSNAGSLIPSRYTLSNFSGFTGVADGGSYVAYPSSGGLFLLEIDDSGIMTGAAYPQTSTTLTSAEGYALNLGGFNIENSIPVDDIAEFTADASGTTCDKAGDILCGIIDENYPAAGNAQYYDEALAGSYGSIDNLGRYGIAATTGPDENGTLLGGFDLTLYSVDGTTFPFVELDQGQVATGVVVLQNASDPQSGARSHMFVSRTLSRPNAVHSKLNLKKKN